MDAAIGVVSSWATIGINQSWIQEQEYIRNQLQEDIAGEQMTLKEYVNPSTGDKNTKA